MKELVINRSVYDPKGNEMSFTAKNLVVDLGLIERVLKAAEYIKELPAEKDFAAKVAEAHRVIRASIYAAYRLLNQLFPPRGRRTEL